LPTAVKTREKFPVDAQAAKKLLDVLESLRIFLESNNRVRRQTFAKLFVRNYALSKGVPIPPSDDAGVYWYSKPLLSTEVELSIPKRIQVCPYCGEPITASFNCWSERDNGTWQADEVMLSCPHDYEADHYYMPYVYLLPAANNVLAWVNRHYRFDCEVHG
jgi:hypothetical protein